MTLAKERYIDPRIAFSINHKYEWFIRNYGFEEKLLNQGVIAKIFKGLDYSNGKLVVVKVLHESHKKNDKFKDSIIKEAEVLKKLDHPGIPKIYEVDKENSLIVMEYCGEENLGQLIKDDVYLTPQTLIKIFNETASVIDYAHSEKEYHGDLDPYQVVPNPVHTKVVDWGSSVGAGKDGKKFTPNPDFAAPERQLDGIRNLASEEFSLAAIAYYAITGKKIRVNFSDEEFPKPSVIFDEITIKNSKYNLDKENLKQLNTILKNALSDNPEIRYKTAIEFADKIVEVMKNAKGPNKSFIHKVHDSVRKVFSF